ncbi:hypothetical protein Droror1_Dr00019029 [Drosera rotundifolia]
MDKAIKSFPLTISYFLLLALFFLSTQGEVLEEEKNFIGKGPGYGREYGHESHTPKLGMVMATGYGHESPYFKPGYGYGYGHEYPFFKPGYGHGYGHGYKPEFGYGGGYGGGYRGGYGGGYVPKFGYGEGYGFKPEFEHGPGDGYKPFSEQKEDAEAAAKAMVKLNRGMASSDP